MILPCSPVFVPKVTPVVRAVLHAAARVRSHVGHHVVHGIHHAVHSVSANPAAVIGFACRTAPGWTAAGLLALPLLQPLHPLPAQPPITTPSDVQGSQAPGGLPPLPAQQAFGGDVPAKGPASAVLVPRVATEETSAVAPQGVASGSSVSGAFPPLPSPLPTSPYPTLSPDKIAEIIAQELPASPQPVPEPSSLLVLASGFYSLRWMRRRHQPIAGSGT